MIIPIIAIFAILTFIATMLIKNNSVRKFFSTIFFTGLILSLAAMIANDSMHFGMKGKNVTREQVIYSAGDPVDPGNILIYKNMGSEVEDNAYVYRLEREGELESAVPARNIKTNIEIRPNQQASIVTTSKEWVYQNDFFKMLFSWNGEENKVSKQEATIYYPDDTWVVMSETQSKKLTKMIEKAPADLKKDITQQTKEIRKLAETDPIAAGQQQVEMIKDQLASPLMK